MSDFVHAYRNDLLTIYMYVTTITSKTKPFTVDLSLFLNFSFSVSAHLVIFGNIFFFILLVLLRVKYTYLITFPRMIETIIQMFDFFWICQIKTRSAEILINTKFNALYRPTLKMTNRQCDKK